VQGTKVSERAREGRRRGQESAPRLRARDTCQKGTLRRVQPAREGGTARRTKVVEREAEREGRLADAAISKHDELDRLHHAYSLKAVLPRCAWRSEVEGVSA